MVLPSFSEFIRSVPASSVAADSSRWLEDCLLSGVDHLILTDDHDMPVRALTLHQLLSLIESSASPYSLGSSHSLLSTTAAGTQEQLSLRLGIINATISTVTAARMIATAPDLCWVAVDKNQRYQGLIDKTRLLAIALAELTADESTESLVRLTPAERQTSKSNTALLTYLGHELKTPLTSLLGLSSLLKAGTEGELSPRQNRYIGLIQQHCRRLTDWVNTLIDLGRLESGTLRLLPQMVKLNELWQVAYRQAALRVGRENDPTPPLPETLSDHASTPTLVADPTRLQQMLSCLIQAALVAQSTPPVADTFPMTIEQWEQWFVFVIAGLEESLSLEQVSQMIFTLPFPTARVASSPLSAEMGHWLEWLLVRKLAWQHSGELVLSVHARAAIRPTLILPVTPNPPSMRDSRFLLVVAPLNHPSLSELWQQVKRLDYRLFITPQVKEAIEIAAHLPISAVLVLIQSSSVTEELTALKLALKGTGSLTVALVPPDLSSMLGELTVDRELLWPTDALGSVLLQPPAIAPAPNRLTLLYLKATEAKPSSYTRFPHIFHDFGCRVLEVDDLDQASLLRRVWRPDIAILDPAIVAPHNYLQDLAQLPELTSLPLITLTLASTQAAYEIPTLSVFPCLVAESSWDTPEASERLTSWLIQVLQVAATKHQTTAGS